MGATKKINRLWNIERNDDNHTISSYWALLAIILALGIYGLMYLNFIKLPTLKPGQSNGDFDGQYAYDLLKNFTSLGPKVCGSPQNEVDTVNFLLDEIGKIRTDYEFDISEQESSGGFLRGSRHYVYVNLKNIVVRVRPRNQPLPTTSVLINSHFDSVPTSPGGGDDGSMVVMMLGVLRAITTHMDTQKHSIIFLFNGCEEKQLAGSHAFITNHEWASTVRAVINLDAAGAGSKEILFQTSPEHSWLLNYYNTAPHPFAQVLAEELFQRRLIPSYTDFEIFVTFGGIIGMDFAYALNGYVYHTKYDNIDVIPPETLQHTGDNILATVKGLANAPELNDLQAYASNQKLIYFDYNGWFLVSYTERAGLIINIIVAVAAIISIGLTIYDLKRLYFYSWRDILVEWICIFVVHLITFAFAGAAVLALLYTIDGVDTTMVWFAQPIILFGLYFCLFFAASAIGPALYITYRKRNLVEGHCFFLARMFMTAQCLIFVILLLALQGLGIRSAYIILVGLFFYTVAALISSGWSLLRVKDSLRSKNFIWLGLHCLLQAFAYMFYVTLTITAFGVFIPISGRSGINNNPEFMIGLFSIMMGLMLGGFFMPLVTIFKGPKKISAIFLCVFIIHFILIFILFPYAEGTAPQRVNIYHLSRTYDMTPASPLYIIDTEDRNGPKNLKTFLNDNHPERKLSTVNDVCENDENCLLLFVGPNSYRNDYTTLLPAVSEPPVNLIASLRLLENPSNINSTHFIYKFELTGPNVFNLFISPLDQRMLAGWTILNELTYLINSRTKEYIYIVNLFRSSDTDSYLFDLIMEGQYNQNVPTLKIAFTAIYDHSLEFTSDYQSLVDSFPTWMDVVPEIMSYQIQTF